MKNKKRNYKADFFSTVYLTGGCIYRITVYQIEPLCRSDQSVDAGAWPEHYFTYVCIADDSNDEDALDSSDPGISGDGAYAVSYGRIKRRHRKNAETL